MTAPRADGAGDPELAAPLGGQHHEDEEDQQDARGDREAAEGREQRHERVALRIRDLEPVLDDAAGIAATLMERFGAGEQNRTLHVPIVGDRQVEGPENFYVRIAVGDSAEALAQIEVIIDDDD